MFFDAFVVVLNQIPVFGFPFVDDELIEDLDVCMELFLVAARLVFSASSQSFLLVTSVDVKSIESVALLSKLFDDRCQPFVVRLFEKLWTIASALRAQSTFTWQFESLSNRRS